MFRRKITMLASAVLAAAGVATVTAVLPLNGAQAASGSSSFPLADPDTVRANDGRYVTYGTSVKADVTACGGSGEHAKWRVPYLVHGSASNVGMARCASGDALPGGPGGWAKPGSDIWAPGVVKYNGKFLMYYTATKAGTTNKKCIGLAESDSARGPFREPRVWACPSGTRWAIDANPVVDASTNRLYVTYRDDAITSGPETGISIVRTDSEGKAVWSTRKSLLKSTDISWDTKSITTETHVVENPAMLKRGGVWYVFYSGNQWNTRRYATGIAKCGSSPLPAQRCTPMARGVQRPYFGFRGENDLDPYRTLPGNHFGPGGMDVFRAQDNTARVVWHWYNGKRRFSMTGTLSVDSGGFLVR